MRGRVRASVRIPQGDGPATSAAGSPGWDCRDVSSHAGRSAALGTGEPATLHAAVNRCSVERTGARSDPPAAVTQRAGARWEHQPTAPRPTALAPHPVRPLARSPQRARGAAGSRKEGR